MVALADPCLPRSRQAAMPALDTEPCAQDPALGTARTPSNVRLLAGKTVGVTAAIERSPALWLQSELSQTAVGCR